MKVVITDWGFTSLNVEREIFSRHNIVLEAHQCKTEDDVCAIVADADVVMTQWAPVKSRAIAAMQTCRGIVRYGIGLDNVDLAAAKERGIPVRNVPDYCLNEVADHTMALMLALQRQVSHTQALVRGGVWKITPPQTFPPLRACTLGLIGFGQIARLVAERAKSFGPAIMAFDPYASDDAFNESTTQRVDLQTLLTTADLISLHLPLTDETKYLINAQSIARMKPGALIVNTSRGGLIKTQDLLAALQENRIGGAALDVIEEEPLKADHPLLALQTVIVTSHTAWYSSASVGELQRLAAIAAVDLLS